MEEENDEGLTYDVKPLTHSDNTDVSDSTLSIIEELEDDEEYEYESIEEDNLDLFIPEGGEKDDTLAVSENELQTQTSKEGLRREQEGEAGNFGFSNDQDNVRLDVEHPEDDLLMNAHEIEIGVKEATSPTEDKGKISDEDVKRSSTEKLVQCIDDVRMTPYRYLLRTNLLAEVRSVISILAANRPRMPLTSEAKCAALFMGYYFKSLNMKIPYENRQRYRVAMSEMLNLQSNALKLVAEIKYYYCMPPEELPSKLCDRFEEFLHLGSLSESERVLNPQIPGVQFNSDAVPEPKNVEVDQMLRTMIETVVMTEDGPEKASFLEFCKKTAVTNQIEYQLQWLKPDEIIFLKSSLD